MDMSLSVNIRIRILESVMSNQDIVDISRVLPINIGKLCSLALKLLLLNIGMKLKNALLNDSLFTEKYDSYKIMKVHEEISMEEVEELTPDRILSEIEIVPVKE